MQLNEKDAKTIKMKQQQLERQVEHVAFVQRQREAEASWLHGQDKQEEEQRREAGGTDNYAYSHLMQEEDSSLQEEEKDDDASSHLTEDGKSSL
jgi:hypothetical protein